MREIQANINSNPEEIPKSGSEAVNPENTFVLAEPPVSFQRFLSSFIMVSITAGLIIAFTIDFDTNFNAIGELEPVTLPRVLYSPNQLLVKKRLVDPGQLVEEGEILFYLVSKETPEKEIPILSPAPGIVYSISHP